MNIWTHSEETGFIQFHYDIGNDFYALFLDAEMQYSCAYFTDWDRSLEQAQTDYTAGKIRRLGLEDRVTVELRNYENLDGEYDKIS